MARIILQSRSLVYLSYHLTLDMYHGPHLPLFVGPNREPSYIVSPDRGPKWKTPSQKLCPDQF